MRMKRRHPSLLSCRAESRHLSLLAFSVFVAAVGGQVVAADVPQRFAFDRYARMLSSSPFGPATPRPGLPSFFKDLHIKNFPSLPLTEDSFVLHFRFSDETKIIRVVP